MGLTEEQAQIRDMTRVFAREQLAPGAAERDREARFPAEPLRAMAELGLLGTLTPEKSSRPAAFHPAAPPSNKLTLV